MRIRVEHTLGDLVTDLAAIPNEFYRQGRRVVKENVIDGGKTARRIARWKSGPHGSAYYKRITWDTSASSFRGFGGGEISGEYGPHGGGEPVGAGFRHGATNMDMPESLDLIRPRFNRSIDQMLDSLFWIG